jgi:hypothetical protein
LRSCLCYPVVLYIIVDVLEEACCLNLQDRRWKQQIPPTPCYSTRLTKCSQELAIECYSASTEVCPQGHQNVSILSSRCTLAVIPQKSLHPPRIYGLFSPRSSKCLLFVCAIIFRRMQTWYATMIMCSRTD